MVQCIGPLPPPSLPTPLQHHPEMVEKHRRKMREFYWRATLFREVNRWWNRMIRRLRGEPVWITNAMLDDYVIRTTNRRYNWGQDDPSRMIRGTI